MKIEAASRLLASQQVHADADESLARKYIRHYTGVDSDTLRHLHKYDNKNQIAFSLKTAQDFIQSAKELTKHFGKPDTTLATRGNKYLRWKLDDEKSIALAESDINGNQFVLILQDKRPQTFEEKLREARENSTGSTPTRQGTKRSPNMGWRTGRRR